MSLPLMVIMGAILLLAGSVSAEDSAGGQTPMTARRTDEQIEKLPPPDRRGSRPLEGLLQARRSVRGFAPDTLSSAQIGQLLWAACGETQSSDFTHRTIPSAGALYPLELYLLTARGLARYDPGEHSLRWYRREDGRARLAQAALGQEWMREAPAIIVIAAEPVRTTRKYGDRGHDYVDMEAGMACQNLLLAATALGLGGTPVGAFRDERVSVVLELPAGQVPRLIVPLGRPRQD